MNLKKQISEKKEESVSSNQKKEDWEKENKHLVNKIKTNKEAY